MRLFGLLIISSLAAAECQSAEEVDCKGLAESYATMPALMTPLSLAKTRSCIDDQKWTGKIKEPSPKDKSQAVLSLNQGEICEKLSARFAAEGPGSLDEIARTRLRKCIDEAITIHSSQPRPGYKVWQPPANLPDGRV